MAQPAVSGCGPRAGGAERRSSREAVAGREAAARKGTKAAVVDAETVPFVDVSVVRCSMSWPTSSTPAV
jgi:hypothetical protein